MRWDYYKTAMFCAIYGRHPRDYLNDEIVQDDIPKFPSEEYITYLIYYTFEGHASLFESIAFVVGS